MFFVKVKKDSSLRTGFQYALKGFTELSFKYLHPFIKLNQLSDVEMDKFIERCFRFRLKINPLANTIKNSLHQSKPQLNDQLKILQNNFRY